MELSEIYKEELLTSIPVVSGMHLSIYDIKSHSISILAPLEKNINYEGTAFGGSINTLCILSSYLLVHHLIRSETGSAPKSLVIQNGSIDYLKPVTSDFIACSRIQDKSLERFMKIFSKKKLGRIEVSADIRLPGEEEVLAVFKGRFVVNNQEQVQ